MFTSFLTVSSASVDASNILTVNSTAHGKSPADNMVVSGGTVRNPLSGSELIDDTVKFTTKYEHDFIKPSLPGDDQILMLDGFGNVWDDTFDIIDVPNRMTFIVNLPEGETLAPSVDESQYLIEERTAGVSGVQIIATVPDVDSFTIDLSGIPSLPIGPVDDLTIISGFRISAVADFKRAQAVYSEQTSGDAYLFVIMTDGDVSKDRHTLSDAVADFTNQDLNKLSILRNFSTVVFLPTGADLSGVDAQDLAYSTIYSSLLASLFGFSEESERAIKFKAVPVGDGPAEYNSAYYAHTYDWQLPTVLTFEDGFLQVTSVAFRDIAATFKLFNDPYAEMSVNIDLDEDEL
jgi:hypothetical protein